MKLNGNWDLTNFSKNLNLKYKIGIQILYVSTTVLHLTLSLNGDVFIYQYPKFIAEFTDKVFTKEVSLAISVGSIDKG